MMTSAFQFPTAAQYGRVIAKSKFYEKATSSSALKNLLTRQAEQIRWSYKLAPGTTNIPESSGVQEIQIITIEQKEVELDEKILQAMDRTIPSPVMYELKCRNKMRYAASYKRPSETDKSKWVNSAYFYSAWLDSNHECKTMPVALSLGALYELLLQELMQLPRFPGEQMQEFVTRVELWQSKNREAELLKKRRDREKQFKHKVELNQMYNALLAEIEALAQNTAEN